MLKKRFCLLVTVVMVLFLTACSSDSGQIERKPDNITAENLEYYSYESGSSSLCVRTAVYPYNGSFIFIADYFNCGNELMETRCLSEEETKYFLERVNTVSAKETKTDRADGDGAYTEKGDLSVNGVSYLVEKIDFESIGIKIKDIHEVEYPPEEEKGIFEQEGMQKLQDFARWKEQPVFIGAEAFKKSVEEQIEARLGEEIASMEIDSLLEEDFTIKVKAKGGEIYTARVTYMGYVAETEGE